MSVIVIASLPIDDFPQHLLTKVYPGHPGSPSEPRVWGVNEGRYRLIPISWLPTGEALDRGLEAHLSSSAVASYRAYIARTSGAEGGAA